MHSSLHAQASTIANRNGKIILSDGDNGVVAIAGTLNSRGYAQGNVKAYGRQIEVNDDTNVNTYGVGGTGHWQLSADQLTVADNPIRQGSRISSSLLNNNLQTSNIELISHQDLKIANEIGWSSPKQLTLTSQQKLLLNANLKAIGDKGGVALNHGSGKNYKIAKGNKRRIRLS